MKRINAILILLILLTINCIQAQNKYRPEVPLALPPSPQAKQFMRYGEIPVDLSSGVPEISIPLYTISTDKLNLPISISYHAGGNKVSDIASVVGLGWVLNAGGMISQSVNGNPDNLTDYLFSSAQDAQTQFEKDKREILSTNNKSATPHWYFYQKGCPTHNCAKVVSDRYFYRFNGNMGVFRQDIKTKEFKTIPYAPLKINTEEDNNKNITSFEIIDTEGRTWVFKRFVVMMDKNQPHYYSGCEYHLSKIKFPDSTEEITFTYKTGQKYVTGESGNNINWYLWPKRFYSEPNPILNIIDVYSINIESQTINDPQNPAVFCTPVLLSTIEWKGGKVEFTYQADRKDTMKERLDRIVVKDGTSTVKTIILSNNKYLGNNHNYRMLLDNITINEEKYKFKYNESLQFPSDFDTRCSIDFWGYYNGANASNSEWTPYKFKDIYPHSSEIVYSPVRESNPNYTQVGILTDMIYPTGGYTHFVYEQNEGKNVLKEKPEVKYFGGLRVKDIFNYDQNREVLTKKSYEYEGGPVVSIDRWNYYSQKTFMEHATDIDPTYSYLCNGNGPGNLSPSCLVYSQIYKTISSSPLEPITNPWGTSVFYNKVIESVSGQGKTEYSFQYNISKNFLYEEWGHRQPLLKEKHIYEYENNEYKLKQSTINNYQRVGHDMFTTGVRIEDNDKMFFYNPTVGNQITNHGMIFQITREFYYEAFRFIDVLALRSFDLLDNTETKLHEKGAVITTKTTYTYDPDYKVLTPIQESTVNSDGLTHINKTTYPHNYSGSIYKEMVTRNILSPAIEYIAVCDGKEIKRLRTDYMKMNNLILPEKVQTSASGIANLRTDITYQYYPDGNIKQYTTLDGVSTVYLWGYKSQYPIAEIKNATFAQVIAHVNEATLNSIAAKAEPSATDWTLINNLRSKLSGSFVATYTYKPLIGIKTVTDPSGNTTTYEYDTFNRLEFIKDHDLKKVQENKYNYKN